MTDPPAAPRLPEDPRLRCRCTGPVPFLPPEVDPRCGWRATAEDQRCDGCRTGCAAGLPLALRLQSPSAAGIDPHHPPAETAAMHLITGQPPRP